MNHKITKLIKKLALLNANKKFHQALSLIQKSKADIQNTVGVQKHLAIAYIGLNQFSKAKSILLHLNQVARNQDDILFNLSLSLFNLAEYEQALGYAKQALALDKRNIGYHLHLAKIYQNLEDYLNAVVTLKNAGLIAPDNRQVRSELATLLLFIDDYDEAISNAQVLGNDYLGLLVQLNANIKLNDNDAIKSLIPQILDVYDEQDLPKAINLVSVLRQAGEFETANEVLFKLPDNTMPEYFTAVVNSNQLDDSGLASMAEKAQQIDASSKSKRELLTAIANQYFKRGDVSNSFYYYAEANKLSTLDDNYKASVNKMFNQIQASYLSADYPKFKGMETDLPVFIIGMPRSGTTLLESIIAAHSNAFGAGETPFIRQALNGKYNQGTNLDAFCAYCDEITAWTDETCREKANAYLKSLRAFSSDATRIVDKMPHNFLNLGAIKLLFPNAHVIHIKRNPIATCLSIYRQNFAEFHEYRSDMAYLAEYYKQYQDLMTFWNEHIDHQNYLEITYEDLVSDNEQTVRQVLEFLDLKFEKSCIEFYKNKRTVATASNEQVRQKLYKTSLAPWQGIEEHIQPLIEAFPEAIKE